MTANERYKKIARFITELARFNVSKEKDTFERDIESLKAFFNKEEYKQFTLKNQTKYIFTKANGISLSFKQNKKSTNTRYEIILSAPFKTVDITEIIELQNYISESNYASIVDYFENKNEFLYYLLEKNNMPFCKMQINTTEYFSIEYKEGYESQSIEIVNTKNHKKTKVSKKEAIGYLVEIFSLKGVINRFINDTKNTDIDIENEKLIECYESGKKNSINAYEILYFLTENHIDNYNLVKMSIKSILEELGIFENLPDLDEYFIIENPNALIEKTLRKKTYADILIGQFGSDFINELYDNLLYSYNPDIDIRIPMLMLHQRDSEKFAKFCFLRAFEEAFKTLDINKVSDSQKFKSSMVYKFLFYSNIKNEVSEKAYELGKKCLEAHEFLINYYRTHVLNPYLFTTLPGIVQILEKTCKSLKDSSIAFYELYMEIDTIMFYTKLIKKDFFDDSSIEKRLGKKEFLNFKKNILEILPIDDLLNSQGKIFSFSTFPNDLVLFPISVMCYNPLRHSQYAVGMRPVIEYSKNAEFKNYSAALSVETANKVYNESLINHATLRMYKNEKSQYNINASYNVFEKYLDDTYMKSYDDILKIAKDTFFNEALINEYKKVFQQFTKENIYFINANTSVHQLNTVEVKPHFVNEENSFSN